MMLLWTPLALAGGEDYTLGMTDGQLQARVTPCYEWAGYSAGATCVLGCIGCVGVPAAAYLTDPEDMPPFKSGTFVPTAAGANVPVPEGIENAALYQAGYEQGFDQELKRRRALMSLAGGAAVVLTGAGLYLGAVAFVVGVGVL